MCPKRERNNAKKWFVQNCLVAFPEIKDFIL